MHPHIAITTPTPPRASTGFRLLYRGALSLPDSHLLLDGLTFAVRLTDGNTLLASPLALALESMRGRPSLRCLGTTTLAATPHLDHAGNAILLDIHPAATLTKIYFENTFCLDPGDTGIKVALGDSDGPETTLMLIFAKPCEAELQLVVARITPAPQPASLLRLPRPDDPTPRRPPLRFDRTASSSSSLFGARSRTGSVAESSDKFKVPSVPRAGKERAMDVDDEDVFGGTGTAGDSRPGKRKRGADESEAESQMEKANKTIIKQSTTHLLALSLAKSHPEYKDVYGAVYRGVGFALRTTLKKSAVDLKSVERLVRIHANMYVPPDARAASAAGSSAAGAGGSGARASGGR
ncbi:hypothetical protein C8R45DRAFT_1160747 [Mycena sanguinolenta]|nr:hypothetical protein C8R45DRAFT_1160747 [Mycena sanguinolenta]